MGGDERELTVMFVDIRSFTKKQLDHVNVVILSCCLERGSSIFITCWGIDIRTCEVAVHYPPPGERISHYAPWTDTCRIILTVVSFLVRLRS